MRRNFVSRDVNDALPLLCDCILDGDEVASQHGRTLELTHIGITLTEPLNREILLPSRKANLAAQIAETMWVLSGRSDVEWLSRYLPRAADFSDDGKVWRSAYGPRLRRWGGRDQLAYVIDTLKVSPGSRQAVINLWNVTVDSTPGKDVACNNWLHFLSRKGYLDLHVAVRSNDLIWGWSGINQFEWSTLLEIVACQVGLSVGQLHFSVSSEHIYDRHWSRAREIAQDEAMTPSIEGPRFTYTGDLDALFERWFATEAAIREGAVGAEQMVEFFPDPMLKAWLRILQWWWSVGDMKYLHDLSVSGTALDIAAQIGIRPKPQPKITLAGELDILHQEKDNAYGDSWCRRGEVLGIQANIARKVDRLQSGNTTSDETLRDTKMDLCIYLAKYVSWLHNPVGIHTGIDHQSWVGQHLRDAEEAIGVLHGAPTPADLLDQFEKLAQDESEERRYNRAVAMLEDALRLLRD